MKPLLAVFFGASLLMLPLDAQEPNGVFSSATGGPSITQGGVVNSADPVAGAAVAPGSIASIYGAFPVNGVSQTMTTPWPKTLSGLSLQFSGIVVPLAYASPLQVNAQVPWELSGQIAALTTATVGNQVSTPQTVHLTTFAPGLYTMNAQGQGAILDSSHKLVDSSNPAVAGSTYIQIYGTGLGPVTNQPVTGAAAPTSPLAVTTWTPTLTVGGVAALVTFSGLTPTAVGLYQVNAQVPAAAPSGTAVPVILKIGGATSNTVTMAVTNGSSPNPTPRITTATASTGGVLTITGTGFISGSSVQFNGFQAFITAASNTQLTVISASSVFAAPGTHSVVVTNPLPGGGNSGLVQVTDSANLLPLTGKWEGLWRSNLVGAGTVTANIKQVGITLTGSVSLASSLCSSVGSVSGSIAGQEVFLTLTFDTSSTATFGAETNASRNAITGQYAIRGGKCNGDTGGITFGR